MGLSPGICLCQIWQRSPPRPECAGCSAAPGGRCGPWRDEQLAVTNAQGAVVGTVERGAVRVLGIATRAVHLVGLAPDGRMWVQQRSLTKPNHPGKWDTLMGGMVSAQDSLHQALARETWEEAGPGSGCTHAGGARWSRGSPAPAAREGGGGLHASASTGSVPRCLRASAHNQDGEVDEFALLPIPLLCERVAQGHFTPEAGW